MDAERLDLLRKDDDVQVPEVVMGLPDSGEVRVAIRDIEPDRQEGVAVFLRHVVGCRVSRAVAATLPPRSTATIAHSRPKPRDVPLMNHAFSLMCQLLVP